MLALDSKTGGSVRRRCSSSARGVRVAARRVGRGRRGAAGADRRDIAVEPGMSVVLVSLMFRRMLNVCAVLPAGDSGARRSVAGTAPCRGFIPVRSRVAGRCCALGSGSQGTLLRSRDVLVVAEALLAPSYLTSGRCAFRSSSARILIETGGDDTAAVTRSSAALTSASSRGVSCCLWSACVSVHVPGRSLALL